MGLPYLFPAAHEVAQRDGELLRFYDRRHLVVPPFYEVAQLLACGVRVLSAHKAHQFEQAAIALTHLARDGACREPTEDNRGILKMTSVILGALL